ncbi:hypothetical protein PCANC_19076 [Puccinia coronata f. sp. avenae]|uniref:Uncharacterized protein n=1 Tax=Puccinia coronata f. sp. avenae TaxID=200324 RepID=A0A2N5UB02_9BASI|nr:hypothetical protein PCANC_19076 [Puccinia coronata f. sp. avenae]
MPALEQGRHLLWDDRPKVQQVENVDKSVESFNHYWNRQESNQGHDDPEGQNMHTDPALDPDLLDYNPQNQQRPTTSPNDVPQQSSQRKRKQNTRYH